MDKETQTPVGLAQGADGKMYRTVRVDASTVVQVEVVEPKTEESKGKSKSQDEARL